MSFIIKKRKEVANSEKRIYFSLFGKDFIYYNFNTRRLRILCFRFYLKKAKTNNTNYLEKYKKYQNQYSESLCEALRKINSIENYVPEVSVVMPVYNSEKYLEQTLQSLTNQTFPFCEFICVNDGSIDKSGLILDRHAESDTRFKIFHQKNAGAGRTRNFGLTQAHGKYTIFFGLK